MAGIENITNEILQEAKESAAGFIEAARQKAQEAEDAAASEVSRLATASAEKAEQDAAAYAKRIESQIDLRRRQAILAAKQDIIDSAVKAAGEKLANLGDAEYFEMLGKLIAAHVRAGEGELLLSAKDLKRLPGGFAATVAEFAKKAGGTLRVSDEAADIGSGFLLRYGGIDENCTLKALFAEKKESLQDKVREVLW